MPKKRPTLILIDGHALAYRTYFALTAMGGDNSRWITKSGEPTAGTYGFASVLLKILEQDQPDYLAVSFDVGRTFRDDLYAEYKAGRAPTPDDLVPQFEVIGRMVESMGVPVVSIPGFEADDAIATLARQAEARGSDVFICTGDKDMRQLISDRIKILNLRKDLVLDREGLKTDWGIAPEQVIDYLSLVGDSVDNVKVVQGV